MHVRLFEKLIFVELYTFSCSNDKKSHFSSCDMKCSAYFCWRGLSTERAVQSPQEFATQNDYKENISHMADTLANADMQEKGNEMLHDVIDQLQCIASAEELAG